MKNPKFAFCESINATVTSQWHIRKLTNKGLKLGGGADTKALCGREVAWDLDVKIIPQHLESSFYCDKCVQIFQKEVEQ